MQGWIIAVRQLEQWAGPVNTIFHSIKIIAHAGTLNTVGAIGADFGGGVPIGESLRINGDQFGKLVVYPEIVTSEIPVSPIGQRPRSPMRK